MMIFVDQLTPSEDDKNAQAIVLNADYNCSFKGRQNTIHGIPYIATTGNIATTWNCKDHSYIYKTDYCLSMCIPGCPYNST